MEKGFKCAECGERFTSKSAAQDCADTHARRRRDDTSLSDTIASIGYSVGDGGPLDAFVSHDSGSSFDGFGGGESGGGGGGGDFGGGSDSGSSSDGGGSW